jgi:two-component system OmpR family response regulator
VDLIPSEADPPLRVLCVDDNHDVADSEVDLLHVLGFDARACYDGASALREVVAFRPCVCLIDLNMPGMNGDELAIRLREQEGGPPPVLVAVTARSDDESRRRIRAAGLSPHLVKPVDPNELVAVIDRMWDACHGRN